MSDDATRFLASLAQALARMSLYTDGHPARRAAADAAYARLRRLQEGDPHPAFSFIGREVIYNHTPLRDLADWDWAGKLSGAGVQRLEFQGVAAGDEFHAFLDDLVGRMALVTTGRARLLPPTARSRDTPISFGAIGVRDAATAGGESGDDAQWRDAPRVDLSEEADVVSWLHDEVAADRRLPLLEAESVVRSLADAMLGDRRAFLPLLMLKEFDQYTTTHALNVAVLAMALAEELGLSAREARAYGVAGLLHDLGKVKVDPEILRKPGTLNDDEAAVMRAHPAEGARLILASDRTLDLSATVAFEHHIMIDGGGYPTRRTRRACHHASRLVHVCDVFDALRTHRPYRVAWETNAILGYLERRAGREFDADIANAFMAMLRHREIRDAGARAIDEAA